MSWSKRDWFFCLILAVVTMLAYQPAWHGGLLWDDDNCTTPPELRTLDGLRRIWFLPRAISQYYPLLYSSYWIQQRLLGDSTTGYHLVNLLLHIGCIVLVLKILRFLRIPGAELATIIFALHPVNVETVAWIAERKNALSGIFALAATLFYLKFDESRDLEVPSRDSSTSFHSARNDKTHRSGQEKDGPQGRGYSSGYSSYALAIVLFLLGLLGKTAIVTLPLAWLAILWWKRGTIFWRRNFVSIVPFLFLSLAAGLVNYWFEYSIIGLRARNMDLFL